MSRLAGKHHHVDQTGRHGAAAAIEELRALDRPFRDVHAEIGDDAVRDQEPAEGVEPGGRIDEPRIDQGEGPVLGAVVVVGGHGGHPFGRLRASAWSTAMRTATPISTCSRITLRASSATLESISTPRFMGPGCMMSASGLAQASLS